MENCHKQTELIIATKKMLTDEWYRGCVNGSYRNGSEMPPGDTWPSGLQESQELIVS